MPSDFTRIGLSPKYFSGTPTNNKRTYDTPSKKLVILNMFVMFFFEFIVSSIFPIKTIAIAPLENKTKQLRKNKGKFVIPVSIFKSGSKLNRLK